MTLSILHKDNMNRDFMIGGAMAVATRPVQ